ncbi:MAG: peptide chain release factor 1 [Patescibacteria group bacterium]
MNFDAFIPKIESLKSEFNSLNEQLSAGNLDYESDEYLKIMRKRSEYDQIISSFDKLSAIEKQIKQNQEIIEQGDDEELSSMAQAELTNLETQKNNLYPIIKEYFSPKDPSDSKDAILEIRAGTGGEEAELFAGELMRMYLRYGETKEWKAILISENRSELGGIKEAVIELQGNSVFGSMKYESGVHRVQRVPRTEKSGRLHTSAATVAVMPVAEEVDFEIDPKDIRVDVYRASGHGGQGVNTTDSAVRITYLPTNMIVTCQDERSQLKNKAKAMEVLRSRLLAIDIEKNQSIKSEARKTLIGTGDRSEKIRTYNYPQNRVTDHRINKNFYNLDQIIEGNLNEVFTALKNFDNQNDNQTSSKE